MFPYLRPTESKLSDNISALGIPQRSSLDHEESVTVNQLLRCNTGTGLNEIHVVTYTKIRHHAHVIFSKSAKKVRKRNSYTVALSDPQADENLKYGEVEKFVICVPDTQESIHIAIIKPLRVTCCEALNNLNYPHELQGLATVLSADFVSVVDEPESKVAIPLEHIVMKCFNISTVGFARITLVNEGEVVK